MLFLFFPYPYVTGFIITFECAEKKEREEEEEEKVNSSDHVFFDNRSSYRGEGRRERERGGERKRLPLVPRTLER